jgi:hypothetical protein
MYESQTVETQEARGFLRQGRRQHTGDKMEAQNIQVYLQHERNEGN